MSDPCWEYNNRETYFKDLKIWLNALLFCLLKISLEGQERPSKNWLVEECQQKGTLHFCGGRSSGPCCEHTKRKRDLRICFTHFALLLFSLENLLRRPRNTQQNCLLKVPQQKGIHLCLCRWEVSVPCCKNSHLSLLLFSSSPETLLEGQ